MKQIVRKEQMVLIAKHLINHYYQNPCLVLLEGEIGSGKTFLCSEIINLLIPNSMVTSPTFNLLQIYQNNYHLIYHYDLYRVGEGMIYELDIENALSNAICLVEWYQKELHFFQKFHHILVSIKIINSQEREICIANHGSQPI